MTPSAADAIAVAFRIQPTKPHRSGAGGGWSPTHVLGCLWFWLESDCLGRRLSPVGFQYITCPIHNCSEKLLAAPFAGPIDHGSLTVQDDYIFFKVRLLPELWEIGNRRRGG